MLDSIFRKLDALRIAELGFKTCFANCWECQ